MSGNLNLKKALNINLFLKQKQFRFLIFKGRSLQFSSYFKVKNLIYRLQKISFKYKLKM